MSIYLVYSIEYIKQKTGLYFPLFEQTCFIMAILKSCNRFYNSEIWHF